MVEHSPTILASEEKAITTNTTTIFTAHTDNEHSLLRNLVTPKN